MTTTSPQPPTIDDLRRVLEDTGAKINVVFHRILPAATAGDRFSVDRPAFDAIVDWFRATGLAARTRVYFDDNHVSSHDTIATSNLGEFDEVVIAAPAATIGRPDTGDMAALERSQAAGTRIAAHGFEHVRLASYDPNGVLLTTPSGGRYTPAGPGTAPLFENQVLYQLVEAAEALAVFSPAEFVLPYGCFNRTTVALNDRLALFTHLATSDFDLDVGQELRPRLLIEADTSPQRLEAVLLHRIGADR